MRQLASEAPTWLVGHRPLWAVNQGSGAPAPLQVINVALQQALRHGSLDGLLPPAVQLVLAGHMHRFETVTFASARPPQLVVGNSGVAITNDPLSGAFATTVDGQPAKGLAVNTFGYLDVQLGRNGRLVVGQGGEPAAASIEARGARRLRFVAARDRRESKPRFQNPGPHTHPTLSTTSQAAHSASHSRHPSITPFHHRRQILSRDRARQ